MATAKKRPKTTSKRTTGAKPRGKAIAKKPAKKPAKKTAKKTVKKAEPTPIVAIVGAKGAGVSTLAKRLAGDAKFTANRAKCVLGDAKVVVWDVPGQARDDDESDAAMKRFEELLDALIEAAVVVHVIDASDADAERVGCRMNRWIYGSWHDLEKPIVTVFNKRDLAADASVVRVMRETWRDALDVSATRGDGVDALVSLVAERALAEPPVFEDAPTIEGSLIDLQLALIERTRSKRFDGAAIAATLRAWLEDETALSVQFLREANATYTDEGLEREDDGLLFLSALRDDVWNADTLHVVTRDPARVAEALASMGAREVERARDDVVTARWDTEGLRSIAERDAPSAQAIQLEIVRRAGYNAFRGDRVHAWLVAHPAAWRAVAFGRLRSRFREGRRVTESLTRFNTVLELADSGWNADELWVVVDDEAAAERIRFMGEVHWFADNVVTLTDDEARRVAGVRAPARVVELWWD